MTLSGFTISSPFLFFFPLGTKSLPCSGTVGNVKTSLLSFYLYNFTPFLFSATFISPFFNFAFTTSLHRYFLDGLTVPQR